MHSFALAFELARFLHRDSEVAFEVALAAVSQLGAAQMLQDKRYYYRAKSRRYKLASPTEQLLQQLVFRESEVFERRREADGMVTPEDLLIWFLKHLIWITGQRSAFYVVLGLARILYRYSTHEAMAIYDQLNHDSECRYHDDAFRAGKKAVFDAVCHRFAPWLEITRGARGERCLATQTPTPTQLQLALRCLDRFTPVGTCCLAPVELREPHRARDVELDRLHMLIHPPCFERITRTLGLPPPTEQLSIPVFRAAD